MVNGMNNANMGSANKVINLTKGGKINLSKETPGLKKIMIGLGWKCNKYTGGAQDFDLDASCFLVNAMGRTSDDGFIFYNNLIGPNNCVIHQGDNKVGTTDGEDGDAEQIYIDLDLVPVNIEKIAITVTIDKAAEKHQNFGMISDCYCRLVNTETETEQVRFDLGEDFSYETAIVVGEVYRHNGEWKFSAIGQGFSGGLIDLCSNYGLQAEYR